MRLFWLIALPFAVALIICVGFALHAPAHAGECKGQSGIASFYGSESAGIMANGQRFNPLALTAASRTLPFNAIARVSDQRTGRSVTVRISDRGPALWTRRIIDLSQGAAQRLGITRAGTAHVCLERLK